MATLKIISFNVRGLADQTKHCNLFHYYINVRQTLYYYKKPTALLQMNPYGLPIGEKTIHFGHYDE